MRIGNITFKDLENVRFFQIKLYPKHKKTASGGLQTMVK